MITSLPKICPEQRGRLRAQADKHLPHDLHRFTRSGPVFSPTALHDAAQMGDVDACEQALAAGSDPNRPTLFGLTPLHIAARLYGLHRRRDLPARRWEVIVEMLLDAGADPLIQDFQGTVAAGWADGFQPAALRTRMVELAERGHWDGEIIGSRLGLGLHTRRMYGKSPKRHARNTSEQCPMDFQVAPGAAC